MTRGSVPSLNPPVRLALRVESDDLPAREFNFPHGTTVHRTVTAGAVLSVSSHDPCAERYPSSDGFRPKLGANGVER
jgi:hypothetical protein